MTNNFMLFVTVAVNVLGIAAASALVGGVSGIQAFVLGAVAAGINILLNRFLVIK